jgi:hypothetical protein
MEYSHPESDRKDSVEVVDDGEDEKDDEQFD